MLGLSSPESNRFVLMGLVRWIDQSVDPFWACFGLEPDRGGLASYGFKVGFRVDAAYSESVGRHVKRAATGRDPVDIEKAVLSGQLTGGSRWWAYEFGDGDEVGGLG